MRTDIGQTIKKYRLMKGVSQAQLAAELGIAASALSAYESGTRMPKIELREQIAKVLEVDPVELSGIELSEDDEIRLLNKLLAKYAITMGKEGEEQALTKVYLSDVFLDFQELFSDLQREMDEIRENYSDQDSTKAKVLENARLEMEYWLETWPEYDFTYQVNHGKIDPHIPSHHKSKELLRSKFLAGYMDYLGKQTGESS